MRGPELLRSHLQPPRVVLQVCPQRGDRHTSALRQPVQVEEADLTTVPTRGEVQSLAHILNSCQKALSLCHYTTKHDDVLKVIYDFLSATLHQGCTSLLIFQVSSTPSPKTYPQ